MNSLLKKEIITHIFNQFGFLTPNDVNQRKNKKGIFSDQFLIDQKLIFETDGKKYQNNVWSGEVEIEDAKVQFLVADLTEDIPEYAFLLRLDRFPPCALRLSSDPEDAGDFFFKIPSENIEDNGWITAPILIQAKILVAVETLMDFLVFWKKNDNSKELYSEVVSFLKFESNND